MASKTWLKNALTIIAIALFILGKNNVRKMYN